MSSMFVATILLLVAILGLIHTSKHNLLDLILVDTRHTAIDLATHFRVESFEFARVWVGRSNKSASPLDKQVAHFDKLVGHFA